MALTDKVFLSNDTAGFEYDEKIFVWNTVNESSAHGASAAVVPLFMAPANGRIIDFQIGVVLPAVSASGFVSGTADAALRINSVAALSTNPKINMAGSAGQATRIATFTSHALATSGVVNNASSRFSAGDMVQIDYDLRSVGSAAAGAAGKGLYVTCKARFWTR